MNDAIPVRVYLAPMSGVTDGGFRRAAARFGARVLVTEMVASRELQTGCAESWLRAEAPGEGRHVVQLVGRDPDSMAAAARIAEGAGADAIDLNMGCPAKKVTGGLAGAALMRDEALAVSIMTAVVRAVRVPVSVKMRLGWDASSLNAAALARTAGEVGVQRLTVHGRTRCQFYAGLADWRAIRPVRDATPMPLVANGDVTDVASARACLEQSGAGAVMVGRAAVGRPWLIGQIEKGLAGDTVPEPPRQTRAEAATAHIEWLLSRFGRDRGLRHARKHLAAYADAAQAGPVRDPLVRTDCADTALRLLRQAFEPASCAAA